MSKMKVSFSIIQPRTRSILPTRDIDISQRTNRMIYSSPTKLSILQSKESVAYHIFATLKLIKMKRPTPSLNSKPAGSGLRDTREPISAYSSGIQHLRLSSMSLITTSQSLLPILKPMRNMARASRSFYNCKTQTNSLQVHIHSLTAVKPKDSS